MTGPRLAASDRSMLAGRAGEAARLAMDLVVRVAAIQRAPRLIDVESAHVDSCLYHGRAGVDFAERLIAGGGRVRIPTTLNVSSLDLLHPTLYRGDSGSSAAARRLMDCYVEMGCLPTWTCAPYQLQERPAFGTHVAWAESNAIVFCNSVLGARTDRYGDFIDICAAITGRVPDAGFHREEHRRARISFRVGGLPPRLLDEDVLYPVLGHFIGRRTGSLVPAIEGLPPTVSEDRLKALGAAAASSGSVALFHAIGVTPEAPTLDAVTGGATIEVVDVTPRDITRARDELTTTTQRELGAVSIGTPHASLQELEAIASCIGAERVHHHVDLYVSTGRDVLARATELGIIAKLEASGVTLVTDTCTYITPILRPDTRLVMTDSAKWAWYAPGNLGVGVVFGSMRECVRSAVEGKVWRDDSIWS